MKSFHVVLAGDVHECLLKSRTGKVSNVLRLGRFAALVLFAIAGVLVRGFDACLNEKERARAQESTTIGAAQNAAEHEERRTPRRP
jgi:hypothetical protein